MLTLVPTAICAVIFPFSLSTVFSTPTSSRSSSVALVALTTSGTEPSRVDRRTPSALLYVASVPSGVTTVDLQPISRPTHTITIISFFMGRPYPLAGELSSDANYIRNSDPDPDDGRHIIEGVSGTGRGTGSGTKDPSNALVP